MARKLSPLWTFSFVNSVRKNVFPFLFPEEYNDFYVSVLNYWSSDLIEFGTVDNSKIICNSISIDIIRPEAQRSALTSRHAALLLYFSDPTVMKWGSNGLFPTVHWDANRRTLTPGFTHSFLSAAVTSTGALGKQICDPEEKALQGEACLINRIVPVCITLSTRVTLDEAARTEACWM